jgi:hypothetical protein
MVIILVTIVGYYINGYWWIFYYGCWWLLMTIILMVIDEYFIGGYWWLFCYKPLVVINCYFIHGFCIINYCWLLYVILQLLVIIVL